MKNIFYFRHFQFDGQEDVIVEDNYVDTTSCLLCGKGNQKSQFSYPKNNKVLLTIFNRALELSQLTLARRITLIVEGGKKHVYHRKCLSKLLKEPYIRITPKSIWKKAFEKVVAIVETNVIRDKNYQYYNELRKTYEMEAEKLFKEANIEFEQKTMYKLSKKINSHFKDKIDIRLLTENVKVVVPKNYKLLLLAQDDITVDNLLFKAAMKLRDLALNIDVSKLQPNVTTKDLIKGECVNIPNEITSFFLTALSGNKSRRKKSLRAQRTAKFMSEDFIFNIHNGTVKTSKHINTGMMLKSLTGSSKIVKIAHRLGISCSYDVIEGLETALAYNISQTNRISPPEMIADKNRRVVVAHNNFDRFIDRKSSKAGGDTLHDTVGIIAQEICVGDPAYVELEDWIINNAPPEYKEYLQRFAKHLQEYEDVTSSEDSDLEEMSDQENQNQPAQEDVPENRSEEDDEFNEVPNLENDDLLLFDPTDITPAIDKSGRFKRSFVPTIEPDGEIISENLRIKQFYLHANKKILNPDEPGNLLNYRLIDRTWLLSHYLGLKSTPAWVGYNSKIYSDYVPLSRIAYLKSLEACPTKNWVIKKTLENSLKIKDELELDYIEVTYDLAIAMKAYRIIATDPEKYKEIFVHVGFFHVEMAFFHALGKLIEDSGFNKIMVESDLLASGSVGGFILGKHYNRCKRLHPVMFTSLHKLLLERFFEEKKKTVTDETKKFLIEYQNTRSRHLPKCPNDEEIFEILVEYLNFEKDVRNGKYGKTAQFYTVYLRYMEYWFLLCRSVRMGDFKLLRYSIIKISTIFFALNQQNYARWLTKYVDTLYKVNKTHPGLINKLGNGSFGIRRSHHHFSASARPMDYTMEVTQNADAANRKTGIMNVKHDFNCIHRWGVTHAARAEICSHMYDVLDLKKKEDISSNLQTSETRRYHLQTQKVVETFKRNLNPFSKDLNEHMLFNISTGQAVSDKVANFVCNVEQLGDDQRQKFITKCSNSKSGFEDALKRNVLHLFKTVFKKSIIKSKNNKLQEVRSQRDLFGVLLNLALTIDSSKTIDLRTVLSYPVIRQPACFCHTDGTICKTDKSAFMKNLEQKAPTTTEFSNENVVIVDAFAYLYKLTNPPPTFGLISERILKECLNTKAARVDIIFDKYASPSIKDYEHKIRRSFGLHHEKKTRDLIRQEFDVKNIHFKKALATFLVDDWKQNDRAAIIKNKTLYVNYEKCYRYTASNGEVRCQEWPSLTTEQLEADTKMVLHACNIHEYQNDGKTTKPVRVLLKAADADVLIIMLANMKRMLNKNNEIWMQAGVGRTTRYVNISEMYEKLNSLNSKVCDALPGIHAFTGCDFNPAFFRLGKNGPLEYAIKNPKLLTAMEKIAGIVEEKLVLDQFVNSELFKILENFVCTLYGFDDLKCVNEARYQIYNKAYGMKMGMKNLEIKVKNVDPSQFPPCKSELYKHVLRTGFIANIWQQAYSIQISNATPTDYGWLLTECDGRPAYDFEWFYGNQLPMVADIIVEEEDVQAEGKV